MNPYEILGVAKDATAAQIKAAYRAKSKELHPDAGGSAEAFQDLNRAHEILSDPQRRARYDQHGDIEEPQIDHGPDAPAWQIIVSLFEACLMMDQDTTDEDIIVGMKGGVDAAIKMIRNEIAKLKEAKRRGEKLLKRFNRKKKPENGETDRIGAMLRWRLDMAAKQIEQLEAQIPHNIRAKELLDQYRYDVPQRLASSLRPGDYIQFGSSSAASQTGFFKW